MGDEVITAEGLRKRYGRREVLRGIDLHIPAGRIYGLIGPNGAGKTTALKALMGLVGHQGRVEVLGLDPRRQRPALMRQLSFIADVATLPRWLRVDRTLDLLAGLHPRFRRDRTEAFLARTDIRPRQKVGQLSRGMVTQLHLALVMGIDARVLILDEPTLGLDILYRHRFYEQLMEDYFDDRRTILVTTHQVEEIEHILSDVLFIRDGRIVLDAPVDALGERFLRLETGGDRLEQARALGPMAEQSGLGRRVLIYDGVAREALAGLGEVGAPTLKELYMAWMAPAGDGASASGPEGEARA